MKSKENKAPIPKKIFVFAIPLFLVIFLSFASYLAMTMYFSNKIYPHVMVAGFDIGNKTEKESEIFLNTIIKTPENITLSTKDRTFTLSLSEIELRYDIEKSVDHAFAQYRSANFFLDVKDQVLSFFVKKDLPLALTFNEEKLDEFLKVSSDSETQNAVYPTVTIKGDTLIVDKGKPGEDIDIEGTKTKIIEQIVRRNYEPITIESKIVNPALTDEEAKNYEQKASILLPKTILLKYEYTTYVLKGQKLLNLLDPRGVLYEEQLQETLQKDIAPLFERPPQNAVFKFENNIVSQFKPAKDGVTINQEQFKNELADEITRLVDSTDKEATIEVPVQTSAPTITTQEVNDLGIRELIGRGTSSFRGSIPGRVHNVAHASAKLNGVLIPPNTVMSFNDTVGDVSVLTGYKQAYVIKDGKTVLGDGGGLCQVSTTLFRAALNAGLPIVERRGHSYRVGYYEQDSGPGLDATVYSPTTDFKIKNDTPNHILIQTQVDTKAMTLVFELYGTSDGRKAVVSKPVTTSVVAPPEDLYVDDPTLPTGKVTQVEHKAWGAKVTFDYVVTRNGEEIYKKSFITNYRPWQAVYMRGTGPV